MALKLKLDSARLLIDEPLAYRAVSDTAAQRLLIASLADGIQNLVDERDEPPKGYTDRQQARIDALERIRKPTPWQRHALAECYLHLGISEGRYGNRLSSVRALISAYKKSKALCEDEPTFLPGQAPQGIFQILIARVPSYKWLLKLAGFTGTAEQGTSLLKSAALSPNAQQEEARLLYGLVQIYLRDEADAGRRTLMAYVDNQPDDLPGLTMLAGAYMRAYDHGRALAALEAERPTPAHYPFYYPLLMKGELYLQELRYAEAIHLLEQYLTVCSGKRFVKDLHYQLFVAYYLAGDSAKANQNFYAIRTQGEVGTDGDRYALYFSKRGLVPDIRLLRVRLLFDGGFMDRATAALDSIPTSSLQTPSDRAEAMYRRARIAQRRRDTTRALATFPMVVLEAGNDESYYAPMACLQMGILLARQHRYAEAKPWLERVSTYPKHEYKEGLDDRADYWLERVRKAERKAR